MAGLNLLNPATIREALALAPRGAGALEDLAFQIGQKFYRGLSRLQDRKNSIGQISGLNEAQRNYALEPALKANTLGFSWATDNPLVASSYAHSGGGVIPLDLTAAPDAVLDAGGRHWKDYFYKDGRPDLSNEFYQLLHDPDVKNIGVKNIIDPGVDLHRYLSADDLSQFLGNNLLVKDPSALRYSLTKEPTTFKHGGLAALTRRH